MQKISPKTFIIWIFIIASVRAGNSHNINCTLIRQIKPQFTSNLQGLWNVLTLSTIDIMCYLVICPIIFFIQVVIILTYIKQRQLRAKPGNIFCAIVSIQLGLNVHLFANALFHILAPSTSPMPGSFIDFCMVMAIYGTVFTIIHFMYLVMFMFYTIFVFRFSLKKKSQVFWNTLHGVVILVSILITLFFFLLDMMGLNFYGLCSLTSVRNSDNKIGLPIFQLVASFCFVLLGIYTYLYFRKHMPEGENFKRRKQQQSKIILMYVTGFSLFLALESTISILIILNCIKYTIDGIDILLQFMNIVRLVQFVFLIFLILFNQKFRYKFLLVLKGLFRKKDNYAMLKANSNLTQYTQDSDIIFNQRLLSRKQISNQIDLLLLSQVYTIISGIYIAYYEYFREFNQKQTIRGINFRQCIMFFLNNRSVLSYERDARSLIKLKILSCTIKIHCPKVFSRLLALQGIDNVFQSFHIVQNSRKMSNLAQGKGGRSGQFFFFSSDNKYVLKTVTRQQFNFYSENLQSFYDYYISNPKSLLAKILGLFTIKGDQIQRTYYLLLMKNILGCQKDQIVRIYDLKGSKYDRQVLFQQTQINQISKMTLKDLDFLKYESKIKISRQKSKDLAQALKKDTIFLRNLNLLDYSLLIIRVNWKQAPANLSFWGQLQRIPHETEANQFYHIGIIDYLQKWDFNKKSQKWWKKFLGKKDFSAQEPRRYQQRFMQFISQIMVYPMINQREELIQETNLNLQEDVIELKILSGQSRSESERGHSLSSQRPQTQNQD